MTTKISSIWMLACAISAAKPGDLDRNFHPELRAWVAPDHVTLAADGRAWIGGGFHHGAGKSVGDLLRLGDNGGVEKEPAVGYLERDRHFTYQEIFYPSPMPGVTDYYGYRMVNAPLAAPFLLASGDFLLPTASLNWLRMNGAGQVIGKAFPDRPYGATITPQFERDGKLWVIRESGFGTRVLERRNSADGLPDPGFSQAAELPVNVNGAVPGAGGSVWVTSGDGFSKYFESLEGFPSYVIIAAQHQLFQVDALGKQIGVKRVLKSYREPHLITGPAGAFRVIYGPDQSRWGFWPESVYGTHVIDWFSPSGTLEKTKNFPLRSSVPFQWAEAADGSYLASHSTGLTQKFSAAGVIDLTFPSPGRTRSIKALNGGKWLIDGLRRLNADGSEDATWTAPQLDLPARVTTLVPLADGRVLAGGNFATADGHVRNRLVMFFPNGQVDPSFIADDRIGEWRSVAVSGQAVYVVTDEVVNYGNQLHSNLVKLRMDGSLDETYNPLLPTTMWGGNAGLVIPTWPGNGGVSIIVPPPNSPSALLIDNTIKIKVHALPAGEILVETSTDMDIIVRNLARLRPDGSCDLKFQGLQGDRSFAPMLVKADGGFVISGVIYRPNGKVERDLTRPEIGMRPLCEWLGGVLFEESKNAVAGGRLRLWTKRGWATWLNPPPLNQAVSATPGEYGMLYLDAFLADGTQSLLRLLPNGRIDRTFRAPVFGSRERQLAGDWWKAEESGKASFDPAQGESDWFPQIILWHPASRRLWTGGNFNMVDGQPRDGLARISGGFAWFH